MATLSHRWDLKAWHWKRFLPVPRSRRQRRLRLLETLQLGERRFVSVLAVDGRELLIGATPHSLALLADLSDAGLDAFLPQAENGQGEDVQ